MIDTMFDYIPADEDREIWCHKKVRKKESIDFNKKSENRLRAIESHFDNKE
jgi:hypothetical protein